MKSELSIVVQALDSIPDPIDENDWGRWTIQRAQVLAEHGWELGEYANALAAAGYQPMLDEVLP
jgi:hypothetical protein